MMVRVKSKATIQPLPQVEETEHNPLHDPSLLLPQQEDSKHHSPAPSPSSSSYYPAAWTPDGDEDGEPFLTQEEIVSQLQSSDDDLLTHLCRLIYPLMWVLTWQPVVVGALALGAYSIAIEGVLVFRYRMMIHVGFLPVGYGSSSTISIAFLLLNKITPVATMCLILGGSIYLIVKRYRSSSPLCV